MELILHWDVDDGCNFSWVFLEIGRGCPVCKFISPKFYSWSMMRTPRGLKNLDDDYRYGPVSLIQNGFQDGCLKILNLSFYQVIYQIPWYYIQGTWLWHYFNDQVSFSTLKLLLIYGIYVQFKEMLYRCRHPVISYQHQHLNECLGHLKPK